MKDFRDLQVWQKSHEFVLLLYRLTVDYPKVEQFGLTSQTRRAGVSIPSNIAEGCGRGTDADFARFLQMAMGSACEVEYQLLLARDLGFLKDIGYSELQSNLVAVKRMLTALIKRVRS